MGHLFCLEVVIVPFHFGEVCNVLYGELGALDCWRSICKGYLPNGGSDHLQVGNPEASSWITWLAQMVAIVGLMAASGYRRSEGTSMVATGNGSPLRQAVTHSKPWDGATMCTTCRGSGEGEVLLISPTYSLSSVPLVSSPSHLRTPVAGSTLCIPSSGWGLSSCSNWPRGVQHVLPAQELV